MGALSRTMKDNGKLYIIPTDAVSVEDVVTITNCSRKFRGTHVIKLKLEGSREAYHFAPEEHVNSVGGLENYIKTRYWEKKQNA